MKKNLIIMLFILLVATGCRNRKLSDEIYDECKQTVNVIDDYLDKYISKEEFTKMIYDIDCDSEDTNEDELRVCIEIDGLQINLLSEKITTSDIKATRRNLKSMCGV